MGRRVECGDWVAGAELGCWVGGVVRRERGMILRFAQDDRLRGRQESWLMVEGRARRTVAAMFWVLAARWLGVQAVGASARLRVGLVAERVVVALG